MSGYLGQMPSACGDPCECGPCDTLKANIRNLCNGPLTTTINEVQKPCDQPAFCAEINAKFGIGPKPAGAAVGASTNMCKMDTGSCVPDGFFGSVMCFLGS